jgi:hypothetical protein
VSSVATTLNPNISTMYFDNKPIRYFMHNEVLHVCGVDVTKAFGYKDYSGPLKTVEEDDRLVCRVIDSIGRLQPTIFINEPAFYELAFRSNLEAARRFTRKVSGEILPSIRRTGKYDAENVGRIMLDTPRPWELMYPAEFRKLISKTGMSEPEFYIFLYSKLHPEGTYDAMRARTVSKQSGMRRDNFDRITGKRVRYHQYLNERGIELNAYEKGQLSVIIRHMLSENSDRNEFMKICNTVFETRAISSK